MKRGVDLGLALIAVLLSLPLPAVESVPTEENGQEKLDWGLLNADRTKTCILLSGDFEVFIPFANDDGMRSVAVIPVPLSASVSGFCDSAEQRQIQEITLTWDPDGHSELGFKHNLTFEFILKSASDDPSVFIDAYYELLSILGTFQTNEFEFPNALDKDKVYDLRASNVGTMSAPESLSYVCKSPEVIQFEDGVSSIAMSNVHAQAFHKDLSLMGAKDFGPKSFCVKDGIQMILMVLMWVLFLALVGLGIFYIVDRRSKGATYGVSNGRGVCYNLY